MADPFVTIDSPHQGDPFSVPVTVSGRVGGDYPKNAHVQCTLTCPGSSTPSLQLSSGISDSKTWSCTFMNVSPPAAGQQASVSASLLTATGTDLADSLTVSYQPQLSSVDVHP
jgi:hypothetical protein